jgi:hypothetical protein
MAGGLLFRLVKGGILLLLRCLSRHPNRPAATHSIRRLYFSLDNSNGCGNLWAKVADRVPVSSLLSPATPCVSATLRSPDHSVPAPNTSLPAFSSTYKSLSSTIDLQPSRYQQITDPSFRNPFVFSSIQNHGGVGVQTFNFHLGASVPRWQIPCSQQFAASFTSLCALFRTPFLCFQSFAASFAKKPGWGGPHALAESAVGTRQAPEFAFQRSPWQG